MSQSTPLIDHILQGDCLGLLPTLPDEYFAACITDPPYNYEFIGQNWDEEEINRRVARVKDSKTLVKNIPYGSGLAGGVRNARWYQRVRENIIQYQDWCAAWGEQVFRTCKAGAYVLVFNSTRTVAHVQVALERAGFYARDIMVYRRHSGIPKGLNAAKKLQNMDDDDWQKWEGWHSCLRGEWEAICLLQKPLLNNYISTVRQEHLGLLHTVQNGSGFQSNIIEGYSREKIPDHLKEHCTVKPLGLMKHLVTLTVPTGFGHIVLDPFAGTGTTCLAAKVLGHRFLGIEISERYSQIANERLRESDDTMAQRELF